MLETATLLPCLCFNSMKVRLKLAYNACSFVERTSFNSMKVRLKPAFLLVFDCGRMCFNSMKVRLKRNTQILQLQAEGSFNSMKVRLKPQSAKPTPLDVLFQFHEGPIKTSIKTSKFALRRVSIP